MYICVVQWSHTGSGTKLSQDNAGKRKFKMLYSSTSVLSELLVESEANVRVAILDFLMSHGRDDCLLKCN